MILNVYIHCLDEVLEGWLTISTLLPLLCVKCPADLFLMPENDQKCKLS